MSITISNLKEDVTPKLHGTSMNKLSGNFYRYCLEASNRVLARIDPKTTIRSTPITNALYSQVYDYIAPSDLKGNKVNDIKPYKRDTDDSIFLTTSREFDIKKYFNSLNVKEKDGLKFLRVSKKLGAPLTVHTCDSITGDGTWSASDDASSLESDSYQFVSGLASLRFNLSGVTGIGKISNSTMGVKDISSLENKGALFMNMFYPSATGPTSVVLKWGSDSSNYWTKTVTTPHEYTIFRNGWNLLRFDWATATKQGNPDASLIDYLEVIINYPTGTALTGVYVDSIVAVRSYLFEIEYYSSFLFKSSSGVYKELPTFDTDLINLDGLAYNIFLYEFMDIVVQVTKAEESSFDSTYFRKQLDKKESVNGESGLYERYERQYPSESLIEINEYYDFGYEDNINNADILND